VSAGTSKTRGGKRRSGGRSIDVKEEIQKGEEGSCDRTGIEVVQSASWGEGKTVEGEKKSVQRGIKKYQGLK